MTEDIGTVGRIFSVATQGEKEDVITSSMIYRYVKSPSSLWYDIHAPVEEKDPIDAYMQHLFRAGQEHERAVVQEAYPGIEPVTAPTEEEAFRLVLESMAEGVPAFHQAPLLYMPEGLKSRLDILERRDGSSSVFGDYHYIVKEVKSARNVRDHHILQAAFNNYLLGRVQGYTPDRFFVINRDREVFSYPYDESRVVELIDAVRRVIQAEEVEPIFGAAVWPWESYGNRLAVERRDVSVVAGVGPTMRERLVAAGIRTVDDLSRAGTHQLTQVNGIGPAKAGSFSSRADALVKGVHIPLRPLSFPSVRTELFLDLEGTPHQMNEGQVVDMDYLIGVLVREGGRETFEAFVAHDLEGERQMLLDFIDWLSRFDECVIYHWHHYEATRFRRMARAYGLDEVLQTAVLGRLRDLYKDATRGFAFPTHGNSIKAIAPYMGFTWSQEEVSGTESIALYFEYVQDPKTNREKLDRIIRYNREDCEALRVVKDWLASHSRPE